ncbi:hypothetical protein VP455E521_P0002 [Vibrio phage 455E52-1]|nr:hypothetical protein VP455E521_P0002 [Vibrio phage 455E52-1]
MGVSVTYLHYAFIATAVAAFSLQIARGRISESLWPIIAIIWCVMHANK